MISSNLPLIHSAMTLTSAPASPFCLNLFLQSLFTPLYPSLLMSASVSDDPCMHKTTIETGVTKKKKTPYNLGYLSLSPGLMEHDRPAVMAHLLSKLKKKAMKSGKREWASAWHTGPECWNATGVGVACRLRYESCILNYLWSRGLNIHMGSMSFLLDGGHTASTREHRCLECDYTLKLSPLFRRTAPGGMLCWEEKHTTKRRALSRRWGCSQYQHFILRGFAGWIRQRSWRAE